MTHEWKRLKTDGHPPCDGEKIFVGINEAGYCGCFNQHGWMSLAHGPVSVCFYDTAEGPTPVSGAGRRPVPLETIVRGL